MIIRLKDDFVFPDGTNYNLLVFRVVPVAGHAGRMISPTAGTCNIQGRLSAKGAGVTDVTIATDMKESFAGPTPAGLITMSSTSAANANSFVRPYLRIRVTGTVAGGDTVGGFMIGFGFPVKALEVCSAHAALGLKVGDNLVNNTELFVVEAV